MKYDVTVIIIIHAEGCILHRTFRALERSVNYARTHGVRVEILCILDKCRDKLTREMDRIEYRNNSRRKGGANFLERSVISVLDKCYCKNLMAYQAIIGLKRKV